MSTVDAFHNNEKKTKSIGREAGGKTTKLQINYLLNSKTKIPNFKTKRNW
jgi:hypothetical protein